MYCQWEVQVMNSSADQQIQGVWSTGDKERKQKEEKMTEGILHSYIAIQKAPQQNDDNIL